MGYNGLGPDGIGWDEMDWGWQGCYLTYPYVACLGALNTHAFRDKESSGYIKEGASRCSRLCHT